MASFAITYRKSGSPDFTAWRMVFATVRMSGGRKSPSQIVDHKKRLITELIFDQNLSNKEIIHKLNIPRSTFFWYRAKIKLEQERIWQSIIFDNPQYRFMRLIRTLEEAVAVNKQIMNSEKNSPKDRMKSSEIVQQCERCLYQLSKCM